MTHILPKSRDGWQFCNDNVSIWNSYIHSGGIKDLDSENRKIVKWFADVLKGSSRLIDIGCGAGFPSLYLSPYFDSITGIDAAPNMIAAAQENAKKMRVNNVTFLVGGSNGALRFNDYHFDSALLCGSLENMNSVVAEKLLYGVNRILSAGGKLVLIDQDWQYITNNSSSSKWFIRRNDDDIILQHVQQNVSPNREKDIRYIIKQSSETEKKLSHIIGDNQRVSTEITVEKVREQDIVDSWQEECVQFDKQTLAEYISRAKFINIDVQSAKTWNQQILFLTAIKQT